MHAIDNLMRLTAGLRSVAKVIHRSPGFRAHPGRDLAKVGRMRAAQISFILITPVAFTFVSAGAAAASAPDESLSATEVIGVLDNVDDSYLDLPPLEDRLVESSEVAHSPTEPIVVDGRFGDVGVSPQVPESSTVVPMADNVTAFDTGDDSWTIPVTHADGSVQIATVIESIESPTEYGYDLTLPEGSSIQQVDGFIFLWTESGDFLGGIAPAWAEDASGLEVPTRYEVRGSTVVQRVEHTEKRFEYPIVADPWLGTNLFQDYKVTTASGDKRYNFKRTTWGIATHAGGVAGRAIVRSAGWDELKGTWKLADNKATLFQQYDCHVTYAGLDTEWNLERHRSNKSDWNSWFNAFGHSCNWS